MSNDPTKKSPEVAETVCKIRSIGPAHRPYAPARAKYSFEWKEVCRVVMEQYRQRLQQERKLKICKWSRVRKEVMRRHDTYRGRRLVTPHPDLLRQDLEYWVTYGSNINDVKFSYIDEFVRTLQADPRYQDLFDDVIVYFEREERKSLHKLFGVRFDGRPDGSFPLSRWSQAMFVSRPLKRDPRQRISYTQVLVCTREVDEFGLGVVVIYLVKPVEMCSLVDIERAPKLFGHLTAINEEAGPLEHYRAVFCTLSAFRRELRGNPSAEGTYQVPYISNLSAVIAGGADEASSYRKIAVRYNIHALSPDYSDLAHMSLELITNPPRTVVEVDTEYCLPKFKIPNPLWSTHPFYHEVGRIDLHLGAGVLDCVDITHEVQYVSEDMRRYIHDLQDGYILC